MPASPRHSDPRKQCIPSLTEDLRAMPLKQRKRLNIIRAFLIATITTTLMWASVLYLQKQAEKTQLQAIEQHLSSITHAIGTHTSSTLRWIDQAAETVGHRFLLERDALELDALINAKSYDERLFVLFSIINADGALIKSSQPFEKGLDLSDREHIKVHFEREEDFLFAGRPVVGRISGKPSIQFTRKIIDTDGSLVGITVISVNPFYFTSIYQELNLGKNSTIELFRSDGLALVQHHGSTNAVGVDISHTSHFEQMKGRNEGVLQLTNPTGQKTLWVHTGLEGHELHVALALNLNEQMSPIRRLQNQMFMLAIMLSLTIFGLAWGFVKYVQMIELNRLRAVDANQKKTRFLSNVSHELRTPLNGILGYTELLLLTEKHPERREFLSAVQESGKLLLSLVDSLLALSRIEKGLMPLHIRDENIRSLLSGVAQIHLRSAQSKGLDLQLHVDKDVPATLPCDRVKLTQILHNLIRNAVKFTDQGLVKITATCDAHNLVIQVLDTGRGMAPQHLELIFDTFFQATYGETHGDEGFGLGLPIVKELTTLMGGTVQALSEAGQGTTFTVRLPLNKGNTLEKDAPLQEGV